MVLGWNVSRIWFLFKTVDRKWRFAILIFFSTSSLVIERILETPLNTSSSTLQKSRQYTTIFSTFKIKLNTFSLGTSYVRKISVERKQFYANSEKSTDLWCSLTIFIAIWTDFDHLSDLFVEYLFIYSVWRALRDIAYFNDNEKFIQTI